MRRSYLVVGIMILLSPIFAYLAEIVGYSEPLENVAEMLNVEEKTIYSGIMPDYTIEGLNPYLGTAIAGAFGAVLTYIFARGVVRLAGKSDK